MKILIALLLLALIFVFPQNIGAKEANIETKTRLIFSDIFDNSHDLYYVPHNVSVLDTFFHTEYAHLVLNLSSEVLNYGGTHFEWEFVQILLMAAADIEEVGYFTVLIDGQRRYLPEGIKIHEIRVYDALRKTYNHERHEKVQSLFKPQSAQNNAERAMSFHIPLSWFSWLNNYSVVF